MEQPSVKNVTELRSLVERRFKVYDVQFDEHVVAFFVNVNSETLETDFNQLKDELKLEKLVPLLKYQGGEHSIFVVHQPERKFRSVRVNAILFALTWITTTAAGAGAYFSYTHAGLDVSKITQGQYLAQMFAGSNWLWGFLFFSLPLMTILTVHEMGHYVMTKRHGMQASLPFFIPVPPLLGGVEIGTLGAFISMREPVPNKKALLDIGVSGPIAGFLVAIPVLILGMFLMSANPVVLHDTKGVSLLGTPLIYDLLAKPFHFSQDQMIHPMAFAGWVGLFVTAINLLPAGQLDGGHMAASLLGDKAKYLGYAAVLALLILGIGIPGVFPGYTGWLVFALLITFMGIAHPPTLDTITPLDRKRQLVGVLGFGLILLCFTPVPIG